MAKMIFVNLPVVDVAKATAFYEAIGFEKNADFSNDMASSMMWSDAITVMLLGHDFYSTFTDKQIIDAKTQSGALLCLSFDSREAVDALVERAGAAGGRLGDTDDYSFMYQRQFDDPDGYHYSPFWMKPEDDPTA